MPPELIDGPADGAAIVKLSVNTAEPFQEARTLQLPGVDAGGLPAIAMGNQKHQLPADATGFQLLDA
jgi:hypothetical protein